MDTGIITKDAMISIKTEILKEVFPAECDLVGESDLSKILSGPVELKQPSFGAKLNLHDVYQLIAEAANFLNNCLGIYVDINGLIKTPKPNQRLIEDEVTRQTVTIIKEQDRQLIVEEFKRQIKRYE